ncbi:MAG TPA: porin family protein [Flavobacteriales bacterium]|nr:porin family protein [Flavobacteriales bacterium]
MIRSCSRALVIACTALCATALQAQRLFDLGPKAGLNNNDLSFGSGASTDQVMGWHAGLFARVKPPLFPGLQGEVLFSTVGTDATVEGNTDHARLRFNYVQLPLFLVFAFGPLELHGGGYFGHALSSSISGLTTGDTPLLQADPDEDDYGLLGGIGLHVGRFYAGARYLYGLNDIGGSSGLGDVHNRQAQLYIGFGLFK